MKPNEGDGIAHYKSGIFSDGSDEVILPLRAILLLTVCLKTWNSCLAFFSWEEVVRKRLETQQEQFETIFSGTAEFVEYLDVSQVQAVIVDHFGDKTLKELLVQEKELIKRKKELLEDREVKKLYEELTKEIETIENSPRFPL